MSLLLDHKPGSNERLEEDQTKKSKEHSTKAIAETTGNSNTI